MPLIASKTQETGGMTPEVCAAVILNRRESSFTIGGQQIMSAKDIQSPIVPTAIKKHRISRRFQDQCGSQSMFWRKPSLRSALARPIPISCRLVAMHLGFNARTATRGVLFLMDSAPAAIISIRAYSSWWRCFYHTSRLRKCKEGHWLMEDCSASSRKRRE